MAQVNFTYALKRFYPQLAATEIKGNTIADIVDGINERFPGIKNYLVDEQGRLRRHVNIFISNELISDRENLLDPVREEDEVYIMQALSGG